MKAAELGSESAMCQLGYMYDQGLGVDVDFKNAREWYEKAANLGYSDAQCNLGYIYQEGIGVEVDYKEAMKWYLKAAEQNEAIEKVILQKCTYMDKE